MTTYPTTLVVTTHVIRNRAGWVLTFHTANCGLGWDDVVVVRRYRGEWVGEETMTRAEARRVYGEKLKAGYWANDPTF